MNHYVPSECSLVELPPTDIEKLNNKINYTNSRISNVNSSLNKKISNVQNEVDERATEERVDGIDMVIESILEDIIPTIIDGGMELEEEIEEIENDDTDTENI